MASFSRACEIAILLGPVAALTQAVHAVDYLTTPEAQKVLIPKADSFEKLNIELSDDQLDKIKEQSGVRQRAKNPMVWKALTKGKVVGYFFVDEVLGKHEYITYATAMSPEGQVLGIEIMSYRETKGGEVRNQPWRDQFHGKTLSDPFKLDEDIKNISGATLSCRNLTDGVKRLLVLKQLI